MFTKRLYEYKLKKISRKELNYLIPEINQALMKYKDIFLTFFHPDTLVNESPSRAID